ncbi:hypothetical protein [Leifsonia shinshuensis]|uniref:PilN domain-containing protein n=1 Tax=Leifsonia shinshuensis TaxID=150026 RepID=A0A853CQP7_9MICO|nr:hypothetical protein [Leifsonia shinshuensis]NYJ23007.1 hypothetical protein [Leifsonia shinshuensis]
MSITARRTNDADDTDEGAPKRGARAKGGASPSKAAKPPREPKAAKAPKGRASTTEPKKAKPQKPPKGTTAAAAPKGSVASAARHESAGVGMEPRVDLLPPEVRAERRNARTRRGFGWGVLAVVLVVLIAAGGAFSLNVVSQAALLTARGDTASLLAQQARYAPVRDLQKQVALAQAAQQAGASTEIDWKAFLDKVGAAQPSGLSLATVAVDSIAPTAIYQQSTDPLQGPRVGTVTVVGNSAALPNVPAWVAALQKIPGVVDVVPGTVTLDEAKNVYKATVTIHVSESLYTKRFAPKGK